MERRSFLLALGAAALAPTAHALAQAKPVADFRTAVLVGGEFAMRSSKLALTKSTNADILNFANAEIEEQMEIATALRAAHGSVPLRPDHAQLSAKLEAARAGSAFNTMFVQGQLAGHRELLTLNTSYLKSGSDNNWKTVAGSATPLIQQHLATLNKLRNVA